MGAGQNDAMTQQPDDGTETAHQDAPADDLTGVLPQLARALRLTGLGLWWESLARAF